MYVIFLLFRGSLNKKLLAQITISDLFLQVGCHALHYAAANGNVVLINILMENGANINCLDLVNSSSLHTICINYKISNFL